MKETHVEKDTLREENIFLNTLLKKDALREGRDPRRKGHSEGGKPFFNTRLKQDAPREERDPRPKGHSEEGKQCLNTLLKSHALRKGRDPRPKRHSQVSFLPQRIFFEKCI